MGRHIIGYELQQILALVDYIKASPEPNSTIGWPVTEKEVFWL